MLGNHADAFFTTPMPTSVTRGNEVAVASGGMPAPRDVNRSATMAPALHQHFFLNGEQLAGPAPVAAAPSLVDKAVSFVKDNKVMVLGGLVAAFLFLTPTGRRIRAKVGLA